MASWSRKRIRIPDDRPGCKRLAIVQFAAPLTLRMRVSTWRHIAKVEVAWVSAPGTLGASPTQGSAGANGRCILHHEVFVI